ncbi:MAG: hypothetical protein H2069_10100 [Legionella sp.]|nr:hypothetical protein [Legionella sp.]
MKQKITHLHEKNADPENKKFLPANKDMWETYSRLNKAAVFFEGNPILVSSMTRFFITTHALDIYLNDSKKIFQLGAFHGEMLAEYKSNGYSVMGYEYIEHAIEHMKTKGIPVRKIDLNHFTNDKLLYEKNLQEDLKDKTNIFAIRILHYLQPEALRLLMLSLMNLTAKDTTIIIVDSVTTKKPANFYASFFGARTDMKIDLLKTTDPTQKQVDQICVATKR